MKAWFVSERDNIGWYLVHAQTRNKARYAGMTKTDLREWEPEYKDVVAKRCKELDDKPFTIENAETVLYFPSSVSEDGDAYTGEYCTREEYMNQCKCDICKGAK